MVYIKLGNGAAKTIICYLCIFGDNYSEKYIHEWGDALNSVFHIYSKLSYYYPVILDNFSYVKFIKNIVNVVNILKKSENIPRSGRMLFHHCVRGLLYGACSAGNVDVVKYLLLYETYNYELSREEIGCMKNNYGEDDAMLYYAAYRNSNIINNTNIITYL